MALDINKIKERIKNGKNHAKNTAASLRERTKNVRLKRSATSLGAGIKSGVYWLRDKNIFKGFRISYKVIWNVFLIFVALGIIFGCFAGGMAAGYFASLVKDQKIPSEEKLNLAIHNYNESSLIYFNDNKLLGRLDTEVIRNYVPYKEISKKLIHALTATEDEYYFEHPGVVPRAVFRAAYQELTNQPIVTGGSTLTQQLVKNQILTSEVSFERKAKEILLALRLERYFGKKEILEAYLNVVPYGRNSAGQNIAGIGAAAKGVFGVAPDELNIPQAAYLAGLPKNPFTYTPFENSGGLQKDISAGVERAHDVLKRMLDTGYISKKQYKDAMNYNYRKHFKDETKPIMQKYPMMITEVKKRASRIIAKQMAEKEGYDVKKLYNRHEKYQQLKYESRVSEGIYNRKMSVKQVAEFREWDYETLKEGFTLYEEFLSNARKSLLQNGYEIHTTIQKKMYDKMNKFAENYDGYEGKVDGEPMQVGSILIRNNDGAIISFVGGHGNSAFNHATQAFRQNGSTMKPLLVYGPALDMGVISPGSTLADMPVRFYDNAQNEYKTIQNYAGNYHGLVSARRALYRSYNAPAERLYARLNPSSMKPSSYLVKNGVTSLVGSDRVNLSAAIGGLTKGVTVEENTNAFSTFANGGKFIDAYMIDKIVSKKGNIIYKHKKDPKKVFSPQAAYLMLDMMRMVINHPYGTGSDLPSYLDFNSDWAGKTGTSQDWRDAWFVATNPNVTLGVWTGYDNNASLDHYGSFDYHDRVMQLWTGLANAAHDIKPKLMDPSDRFNMPSGIVKRTFCSLTTKQLTSLCQQAGFAETDYFLAKYAPSEPGNALKSGRVAYIGDDVAVAALSSTPDAFTTKGVVLKREFIEQNYPYLPIQDIPRELWSGLVPEVEPNTDGKAPSGVGSLSFKNGTLTWSASSDKFAVGYRVYRAPAGTKNFRMIAEIPNTGDLAVKVGSSYFSYYVTAVDLTGKESGPSKIITAGSKPKPPKPPEEPTGGDGGTTEPPPEEDGNGGDTEPPPPPKDDDGPNPPPTEPTE